MRRFKLLSDQYDGLSSEITYNETMIIDDNNRTVLFYVLKYPEDWQEIFEDKSPWISVKDRLPEEGGRYWCYLDHQNDLGLSHFQWNCSYDDVTKTFSDSTLTDGEKVTHWMSLPEPPKK